MHLFGPKNFIMPFLAHALGTLFGAYVAARIAIKSKMRCAMIVAIWFLIGGIANILMLPSPLWFTILDLAGAYLPLGYVGGKLAMRAVKSLN